ncbi:two-component response-regulatory protein YehT [Enterobacter asburiae]|uniref:Two-component response-regulatory protein YehT n=1 Tax=Enterobacter asburiae TaxID=61645 RepID=A0A376FLD3_ENTAS|nr:two-component response-regulatory protein YehT [Enterobacter asburiae]
MTIYSSRLKRSVWEKTLTRLRQERTVQDVTLLPENQQPLKFIPCTGHSRIYLLQMDDVAFVSSRLSGGVCHQRGRERRVHRADPAHAGEPHAADSAATASIW